MSKTYDFSLTIEVDDEIELWKFARRKYESHNLAIGDGSDLDEMFGTVDQIDVSACLQEILDPGVSPAGTSIIESTVESF